MFKLIPDARLAWRFASVQAALVLTILTAVQADVVPMLAAPMPGAMRSVQGEMDLPRPSGSTQFEEAFDAFDARMQDAARRRFPVTLVAIHRRRIEEDGVSPGTLAWMLDTPVDDLVQVSAALDGAFDAEELFGA